MCQKQVEPGKGIMRFPLRSLGPMSLMSTWSRTYVAARMAGTLEQTWLEQTLVSAQHSGRKSHDSIAAFAELAERYAMGLCRHVGPHMCL